MQGGHEVHGVGVTGEREKFNLLGEFPRGWAGVGCRRLTPQVNADEGMGNVSGSQSRFWELCPPRVFLASALISFRVPCWLSGKESACQRRRLEFDPRVGKIPWGRKWQPRPVSLPGEWTQEPGGIQSMGSQELDTTLLLNHHHRIISIRHKGQCREESRAAGEPSTQPSWSCFPAYLSRRPGPARTTPRSCCTTG